jgi:hypothetical protein
VPIAKLFVEGSLEVQVLTPILLGNPVPQRGGSKYALRARAGTERRENKVEAGYLRDRDFDFDPPADLTSPTQEPTFENSGIPFGWRWCRHEIENYLLEPAIVNAGTGWPIQEIEQALCQTAGRIRDYQAARWTIGKVRRALPPSYDLSTRPDGLNEIDLPRALDAAAVNTWALQSIADHRAIITTATDAPSVQVSLDAFAAQFNDAFVADVAKVLLWFSGKDLLAGLVDWLVAKGVANAGEFRALLRDWMITDPVRTLKLLPEWKAMVELVRA